MSLVGKKVKIKNCEYAINNGYDGLFGIIVKELENKTLYHFEIKFLGSDNTELFREEEVEFIESGETLINPKEHSLVFVQTDTKSWTVYQDGIEVKGIKAIDINAEVLYPTEHTIKYLTGITK